MQAYLASPESRNRKTGPIMVTSSGKDSCPNTCPLKNAGCYATYSYMGILWNRLTESNPGDSIANGKSSVPARAWRDLLSMVKALPQGDIWRHNQMGDLAHNKGKIDRRKLRELANANNGKRGFTYSHHAPNPHNIDAIKTANENGFTVNLSGNNPAHADILAKTGLPVVTVLPASQSANSRTQGGNKIVVCPATQSDSVTCKQCKLCSISKRDFIIGFPAHGTGKAQAESVQ